MNDRRSIALALIVAVIVEITLLHRSGLLRWVASGPHTGEDLRGMATDWRVMASVVLVSVILWLGVRLTKVGRRPPG